MASPVIPEADASEQAAPALRKARRKLHPLSPPRPVKALGRGLAALSDPARPYLAQLIVTRRCNLACGYCNEYDDFSPPVASDRLFARIDHLASLGTVIVTLTGGEPLLHPELDRLIARITGRGMVCTMISNGYPVTRRWIERLNASGLSWMQISVDNLEPNSVSQKSLSKIRDKLMLLREYADFGVSINAVLGSSDIVQTRRLVEDIHGFGFYMTVGLLHDGAGQIDHGLIGPELPAFYREMRRLCRKSIFQRAGEGWEDGLMANGAAPFRCRAGARYLYIDEAGRVSYCSQRRTEPGIDLLAYGRPELDRAFRTPKGCESQCTVACVRRASSLDEWRPQRPA
jgi:MoaA/NifB/PqqE/SkfB family radical SAM enzyme